MRCLGQPQHLITEQRVPRVQSAGLNEDAVPATACQNIKLQGFKAAQVDQEDVRLLRAHLPKGQRNPVTAPNIEHRILNDIGLSGVPFGTRARRLQSTLPTNLKWGNVRKDIFDR